MNYRASVGPGWSSRRSALAPGASAAARSAPPPTATPMTARRWRRCGRALDCRHHLLRHLGAYGNGHSEELIGQAFKARVRSEVDRGHQGRVRGLGPAAGFLGRGHHRVGRGEPAAAGQRLHRSPAAPQCAARRVLQAPDVREALATLVASGKIRAWGASTKSPAEAIDALRAGRRAVVQANFNMMDVRALSDGLFDEVARRQAGFIGRTPLCFGFLAGTIRRDTVFPDGDHRNGWSRAQLDNWIDGAADLLAAVSARPGRGRAERLALLSFLPGGLQRHSRHPDAGRGGRECAGERVGLAAGAGGRGGAGDQPPPPVLRQAGSGR